MSQPSHQPRPVALPFQQASQLGPGSILWRYAGDRRLGLTGLSAGLLQLMHPAIGAGVAQHSDFFNDPWDRIIRSVPQILGVIYDSEPEFVGRRVRDHHRRIKGVDEMGRRYNALHHETFWWAHATFQVAVEQIVDRFDARSLSPDEREDLYRDGVEWYRRYGVSTRAVPADHSAFRRKWKRVCGEVLEMTPAAERALEMALREKRLGAPFLPWWTKPLQPVLVTPLLQLTAIGGLPATVRKRFGIPWRIDQEMEYRALQVTVREWWRWLPETLRHGPSATEARRRVAADAATRGAA